MEIKLHGRATTTPRIRKYIQESDKSITALAKELGVSTATVHKWRHADRIYDASHARHNLGESTSCEEAALIVELRQALRLSVDDITEVMKRCVREELSRSAIYRCLVREGANELKSGKEGESRYQAFEQTSCGFIHMDLKVLPKLNRRASYVFVAIDRATRYVHVELLSRRSAVEVGGCFRRFIKAFPHRVHTVLTDNDGAFTDRFAVFKKGKPEGKPSGQHVIDKICAKHGIEHRLIRPFRPQTNGMVERFNRRISDAIKAHPNTLRNQGKNKFNTHEEREQFILQFVENYNLTRLRCLDYKSPTEIIHNLTEGNTQAGTQSN